MLLFNKFQRTPYTYLFLELKLNQKIVFFRLSGWPTKLIKEFLKEFNFV